jgi:hypothetical protein
MLTYKKRNMPANLPPQFFELQKKMKKTQDVEEKIEILKEMLAVCPKHKGTEKVREDLKRKMAKLRKEIQVIKKASRKENIYTIKKEGAGQVVIVGPPNSGKTTLINALCSSHFKTGDYLFTTTLPQPAMMSFENIQIQLVDLPPLTEDFFPGWMKNILWNVDIILSVFDLSSPDFEKEVKSFKQILKNLKLNEKEILFIGNKLDLEKIPSSSILKRIGISMIVSAKNKIGLEKLKKKIFERLKIVRVYSKKPGEKPNFKSPFVFKQGAILLDFIEEIHQGFLKNFKFAKLYKKDLKNPIFISKNYILQDEDIIELHFKK